MLFVIFIWRLVTSSTVNIKLSCRIQLYLFLINIMDCYDADDEEIRVIQISEIDDDNNNDAIIKIETDDSDNDSQINFEVSLGLSDMEKEDDEIMMDGLSNAFETTTIEPPLCTRCGSKCHFTNDCIVTHDINNELIRD